MRNIRDQATVILNSELIYSCIYINIKVRSVDLADDLVGPSVADTKLRANLFMYIYRLDL